MKRILFLLEELPQLRIVEVESSDCPHSPEARLRSWEAFQEDGLPASSTQATSDPGSETNEV